MRGVRRSFGATKALRGEQLFFRKTHVKLRP
jgi:hypothetical protein